jgi:RNase P/RNase MRP subunit p29
MKHKEFIGKTARFILPKKESIEGLILDETKNTFTVQTTKGKKTIIKNQSTILIDNQTIQGKEIQKRPEDRMPK